MSDRSYISPRLTLAAAALLASLLAWRLPVSLDGVDGVNFALALEDYDPGLERPHYPGYPLYVALCRMLRGIGVSEENALALPGVLASVTLLPALRALALRLGLSPGVFAAALPLVALHPLWIAEGGRPSPDLLGSCVVWSALGLAASGREGAAGLLFGLAMGVRIDLAPFVAGGAALASGRARSLACGLAVGLLCWAVPFLAVAPPDAFARAAQFALGHFRDWGSSLLAGVGSRDAFLGSFLLAGSGAAGLALLPYGLCRALPETRRFLLWGLGPYLAWVLVGQNLAQPRHFLPLVPALGLLVAAALAGLPSRSLRALAVAALALGSLPVYARALAPRLDGRALVHRAVAACADCDALYAGESRRLFDRYAPPGFPVFRRAGVGEIALDLEAWAGLATDILATDEIEGVARLGAPVADLGGGLRLYRIPVSALR
jgi:hypothetical protein